MDIKLIFVILLILGLVVAMIRVIYILIKKVDIYENIITTQDEVLTVLKESIMNASSRLKEHDVRGHYNSDDDLGAYFKTLLEVDKVITEYIEETLNGKNKEGS